MPDLIQAQVPDIPASPDRTVTILGLGLASGRDLDVECLSNPPSYAQVAPMASSDEEGIELVLRLRGFALCR